MVKSPSLMQRLTTLLVAFCLLALSATMAWATVSDYNRRATVAKGVKVAGEDVGGMTRDQVLAVIDQAVAARLEDPFTVRADDQTFEVTPADLVKTDRDGMADEALAARSRAPFFSRIEHDLLGTPLKVDVELAYSVDKEALDRELSSIAEKIDRPKRDASIRVVGTEVEIQRAVVGRKLTVEKSAEALSGALMNPGKVGELDLPVKKSKPKVTEKRFRKAIVVSLSQRKVRLYDNGALEKTYRCAIGTPDHPTPTGSFEIVLKRYRPTWVNPGSAWAKSMPPFIPPGPSNPLGTRALNLSASGIRFHGTKNIASVGTAASHGCMRMVQRDIEDLYDRVYVGTKVFIVR